jgi:hypothetical protein
VKWEATVQQDLPHIWGMLEYTYTTAGRYPVDMALKVECYDTGAKCQSPGNYNTCTATGKTTVEVLPVNVKSTTKQTPKQTPEQTPKPK